MKILWCYSEIVKHIPRSDFCLLFRKGIASERGIPYPEGRKFRIVHVAEIRLHHAGDAVMCDQQIGMVGIRPHIVQQIVDALPEKQRSCMQLRDFEGKSYKEIAEVLEISEEQVKVNIFRARQTVKQKYLKLDNYGL